MAFSGSNSYYTQRELIGSGNNNANNNNIQQEPPTLYPFQSQQPLETSSVYGGGGSSIRGEEVVVRRKRGRPRKYGSSSDHSKVVSSSSLSALVSPPLPHSSSAVPPVTSGSYPSVKRGRGRPPGGGKRHQLSSFGGWLSSSAGIGFTPHIITVSIGEDIATKIISFSQQGPRAICVLCANGSVSTATLRQPSSSSSGGGTITYEGQFEILCLSGSFLLTADSASFSRAGGLSVTLASSDGRVIGGGVGGVLRAATPIQVVVGSFLTGNLKGKQRDDESTEESNPNPNPNPIPNPIRQIFDDSFTPTNVHQNRNPMSTSSMGIWQTSHQDVQSSHADIDLMH